MSWSEVIRFESQSQLRDVKKKKSLYIQSSDQNTLVLTHFVLELLPVKLIEFFVQKTSISQA